jgi:hypothetical protein
MIQWDDSKQERAASKAEAYAWLLILLIIAAFGLGLLIGNMGAR